MKKSISFIISLMMLLALVPSAAPIDVHAAESNRTIYLEPEVYINPIYSDSISESNIEIASDYGITTFSTPEYMTDEEEVVEAIREAMTERVSTLTVYYSQKELLESGFLTRWVEMAFAETDNPKQGDYLRWQCGDSTASGSAIVDEQGYHYTLTLNLSYYTTAEQETKMDAAVDTLLQDLGITDDLTDYEKLTRIYDYMCENITYDYEHLNDDTYKLQFTAYAALINRTSVCQGYACLLYRLLRESGISCRAVSGKGSGEDHGWNIVKLGNVYYNLDATWDAARKQNGAEYGYFLRGSGNFGDHVASDEYTANAFTALYPISTSDYVPCTHELEITDPAVAATCTTTGLTAGSHCGVCGETIVAQEIVPVISHSWDKGTVNSARTAITYTCQNCKNTKTEALTAGKELESSLGLTEAGAAAIVEFANKNNVSQETMLVTEQSITTQKSEEVAAAIYGVLSAKATKATSNKITLKWNAVKGADGYIIYGNQCGTNNKFKKLTTTKSKTYTQKKLKKGKSYKYLVVAYKVVDGKQITIAASKTVHEYTTGGKYGNAKSVKVNKKKVALKKGKTFTIKASEVKKDKKLKKHRKLAYETTNKKVATVSSKGKIKAVGKGSCYVYVYAQNGVAAKVKVTVK